MYFSRSYFHRKVQLYFSKIKLFYHQRKVIEWDREQIVNLNVLFYISIFDLCKNEQYYVFHPCIDFFPEIS